LLKSIADEQISKVMTSSGTTSSQLSRIVLDKSNIIRQQKILVSIVKHWLGSERLPMLIIDHKNVINNKQSYSARGIGIQRLSLFGHHHSYALNDDMSLNIDTLSAFAKEYRDTPIFVFGFTFMIWKYFVKELEEQNVHFDFTNVVVMHSGGWKKLESEKVSNTAFKQCLTERLSTQPSNIKIHNFYGMVEQTGTIYVECEAGYLHTPVWSNITILDANSLQPVAKGIQGIIQLDSLLLTSYPGHSLLTEDIGILHGEDNCSCGRNGQYFSVSGRLLDSEVRGCSDTHS